jgi:polyisoprenoid-binding protein YceI
MKKTIIIIVIGALLVGGYIFIKDTQNKKELSKVEESQFVDKNISSSTAEVSSSVTISRSAGVWSSNSDGEYKIDSSSLKFEFTGYKPGGQHIGTFNTLSAKISLDKEGNPIQATITIDPKTVKTDIEAVDKHLQAPEFFDTAKYPEISLVVKEIKEEGGSVVAITDLIMKGVTKTLAVPVKITKADDGTVFNIETRIKISDYAIAYGPVLDEVKVVLSGVIHR